MQLNAANSAGNLRDYYQRFVTIALVISYAMLHVQLTGVYDQATPDLYYQGLARLPYGQRLFVPLLAKGLGFLFPLSPEQLFFIWEMVFVALTYWAMKTLLQSYVNQRQAISLTWLFFLLLPLVFVVNYRLLSLDKSTIFYPCDSATLFFMTMGLYLCLNQTWHWFFLIVALATINRESGLLLLLLIPCLHWQRPVSKWILPLLGSFVAFLLAKIWVIWMVSDLPGTYLEWYYRGTNITIFKANFYFLTQKYAIFFYCYAFACLPLFMFAFYDYVPHQLRPIRWLCFAYFVGLLMVGHMLEARIYGEIVALLYLPTALGVLSWLKEDKPVSHQPYKFTTLLDRYGIVTLLVLLLILRHPINLLVIRLSAHLS